MTIKKNGYSFRYGGVEIAWYENVPDRLPLSNGDVVFSPKVGWELDGYSFVAAVKEFPDPVEVEPRRIGKSVIISRLTDTQLEQAIGLMSIRQQERWRAPDHPTIYVTDPELLQLLAAVGADPTVVLAEEGS